MQIDLLGMGPGAASHFTVGALDALRSADILIGAHRLLKDCKEPANAARHALTNPAEIDAFLKTLPAESHVCILLSGDTGFFSGAKKLLELPALRDAAVYPGISSLQYFAARLKLAWQTVHIVSCHAAAADILAEVLNHPRVFFLTGVQTPQDICAALCEYGLGDARVTVGEQLSYPSEQLTAGTAQSLLARKFSTPNVMLVENEKTFTVPATAFGLPDSAFTRGSAPMTKAEVRAVTLSKLALREADIVWDIGAGTGSVSVEAALHVRRGRVYAIESEAQGCALIRQNAQKFGTYNLRVIAGRAPQALTMLPAPDAVFIGGSKGELTEILTAVYAKNPAVRLVINAVTLETLETAAAYFTAAGIAWETVQIAVTRAEPAGAVHMLRAQNPVFILYAGGTAFDD